MKRNALLIILAALIPAVGLLAAVGLRALEDPGYPSGQTVGTQVYLKGFGGNVKNLTATTYTALAEDDFISVETTSAVTINLLAAANLKGKIYAIGKGTIAGTQAVTIDPASSEKIDGGTTYTAIDATGDAVTIQSTGTEWVVIGKQVD